eukprot:scaffold1190_cov393-Prasinococcus_capsulatus_cf.AAC.35
MGSGILLQDDKENSGFDFKWLLKYNQLPDLQTWYDTRTWLCKHQGRPSPIHGLASACTGQS